MKQEELFSHTFKALRQELGLKPLDNRDIVEQMQSSRSMFCQSLVTNGYLSPEQMLNAVERYHLGITRDGGVVFWQTDRQQVVRDGKIMFYRPDCHRDHSRHPSWASARLKQQELLPPEFTPQHCLFGLHLLPSSDGHAVAVVESEKTAVIMSEVFPEYVWMACGGLATLSAALLHPLQGCKVVLFPDTDPEGHAFRRWCEVAETASGAIGQPFYVSPLLERQATADQKERKVDLVDYLFEGGGLKPPNASFEASKRPV